MLNNVVKAWLSKTEIMLGSIDYCKGLMKLYPAAFGPVSIVYFIDKNCSENKMYCL